MTQYGKKNPRLMTGQVAASRIRSVTPFKSAALPKPTPGTLKARTSRISTTAKPFAKTAAPARPNSGGWRARKHILLLFAPLIILLILSLLLIGLRMSVGHLAKNISELEAQVVQLQDENNRYLARAEQLASYNRIARLAHERLGLVALAPKLIVVSSE
jgi:cell division protein FtsL